MSTIFLARSLHAIDAAASGDAVAVDEGRITAVGSLAELRSALPNATVDDRYAEATLLPGFVEAHSHSMAGGMWRHLYVGFFDNRDPAGRLWLGCKTLDAVLDRLREAEASLDDPNETLRAWGLDPIYFSGDRLVAEHLDRVSSTRPIFVIHASLHLATVNTALMEREHINADSLADGVPKDGAGHPIGELQEPAAMSLAGEGFTGMFRALMAPEGITDYGKLARNAGVTTVVDLGSGPIASDSIATMWQQVVNDPAFPARVSVFHNPGQGGPASLDEVAEMVVRRRGESTDKLRFGGVKFVLDGSIQGYTARVTEPYINGKENGLWLVPPAQLEDWIRPVLDAGLLLHVHCNGDQAADVLIDAFAKVTAGSPPADHRTTLQHSQLTRRDQYERMAELGMCANLFSNHFWYWGDQHVDLTVGPERAARMNSAATVLELGIPLSIHCDASVTPLGSLHVAWCAANRQTVSGRVLGPDERLDVAQAMHAITMGAAYQLRMDDEVGSISPGKRADFVALDADPFVVGAEGLRDINVLSTMLDGVEQSVG
jgi:predicted amidohydrolase YtcJ